MVLIATCRPRTNIGMALGSGNALDFFNAIFLFSWSIETKSGCARRVGKSLIRLQTGLGICELGTGSCEWIPLPRALPSYRLDCGKERLLRLIALGCVSASRYFLSEPWSFWQWITSQEPA